VEGEPEGPVGESQGYRGVIGILAMIPFLPRIIHVKISIAINIEDPFTRFSKVTYLREQS
jgi:hypothetical protein